MLRIHDRPVLESHVRNLTAAGVREIWINLHHAPEVIRTHFGATVRYSEEEHLLGTAGALRKLSAEFRDGPFFVVYGDNYIEPDYSTVPARGLITMLLHHRAYVAESGVVLLGTDNSIVGFQEKPPP